MDIWEIGVLSQGFYITYEITMIHARDAKVTGSAVGRPAENPVFPIVFYNVEGLVETNEFRKRAIQIRRN